MTPPRGPGLARLLPLLGVVLLAPVAGAEGEPDSADCSDVELPACVWERHDGDGSCRDYEEASTNVILTAGEETVRLVGQETCQPSATEGELRTHGVYVYAGGAGLAWSEEAGPQTSRCALRAWALHVDETTACPAGPPPNPGWGHVLP